MEGVTAGIVALQSGLKTDPQVALTVAVERTNTVAHDGERVVFVVEVFDEVQSVEFVESVFRTYPYIALVVLVKRRDKTRGELPRSIEATLYAKRVLRKKQRANEYQRANE